MTSFEEILNYFKLRNCWLNSKLCAKRKLSHSDVNTRVFFVNQRSQRDDSRIQKERNKANDFTCKLQYDVSIFSNRRQSDLTKCPFMISQCEINDQSTSIAARKFIFRE